MEWIGGRDETHTAVARTPMRSAPTVTLRFVLCSDDIPGARREASKERVVGVAKERGV